MADPRFLISVKLLKRRLKPRAVPKFLDTSVIEVFRDVFFNRLFRRLVEEDAKDCLIPTAYQQMI